ncbi:MAG: isoaspartyl peptidase/L-asparaginase [Phycisphaerales bacterium]
MRTIVMCCALLLSSSALSSCGSRPVADRAAKPRFAIAIHGGAGVIDQLTASPEQTQEYLGALEAALRVGRDELAKGGTALDACEKVVRVLEDDPKFNAGRGAVYTADGRHELDASIMDGKTLKAGAVAGVKTVKNPISLARLVMQNTRHILLAGDGAEEFATKMNVERVPNSYFDTEYRYKVLQEVLEEQKKQSMLDDGSSDVANAASLYQDSYRGTVGCVALDTQGNLAVATSTGGLTAKRWGRIGDSPIIGAGTYANNKTCAVSGTGSGEQFIRHTVARDVAALMEYKGMTANQAASEVVFNRLNKDDGGVIVVSHTGEIALVFSTPGMFRGAADSNGRFEVGIWKDMNPVQP